MISTNEDSFDTERERRISHWRMSFADSSSLIFDEDIRRTMPLLFGVSMVYPSDLSELINSLNLDFEMPISAMTAFLDRSSFAWVFKYSISLFFESFFSFMTFIFRNPGKLR